eukprot:2027370-Pleurochrysis_carterae.AAC.2
MEPQSSRVPQRTRRGCVASRPARACERSAVAGACASAARCASVGRTPPTASCAEKARRNAYI